MHAVDQTFEASKIVVRHTEGSHKSPKSEKVVFFRLDLA